MSGGQSTPADGSHILPQDTPILPPARLYGVRGWGSAIAEGLLAAAAIPYDFTDVTGFDQPGAARTALVAQNPLAQVPTLVLANGDALTETAAIALWCIDQAPSLAPAPNHPDRARFLRLLIFLVANVYPTFTYGDYPSRWTSTSPAELKASTDRHREALYLWLETQLTGPFALGHRLSALDIFLATLSTWQPGRAWFATHTPKLLGAATAAETALPILAINRQAATSASL